MLEVNRGSARGAESIAERGAWLCAFAFSFVLAVALAAVPIAGADDSGLLIYNTEGNRLHRYDVDTIGTDRLVDEVLIERASAGEFASRHGP